MLDNMSDACYISAEIAKMSHVNAGDAIKCYYSQSIAQNALTLKDMKT